MLRACFERIVTCCRGRRNPESEPLSSAASDSLSSADRDSVTGLVMSGASPAAASTPPGLALVSESESDPARSGDAGAADAVVTSTPLRPGSAAALAPLMPPEHWPLSPVGPADLAFILTPTSDDSGHGDTLMSSGLAAAVCEDFGHAADAAGTGGGGRDGVDVMDLGQDTGAAVGGEGGGVGVVAVSGSPGALERGTGERDTGTGGSAGASNDPAPLANLSLAPASHSQGGLRPGSED